MANILIVGCGDVGTVFGLALVDRGHAVWGLRRQASGLPGSIFPLQADVTAPGTLASIPKSMDYVFYLAAAGHFSDAAYQAAYVGGVSNVLKVLTATGYGVQHFFFASSTGVYGQYDGVWVDENSATEPKGFSGKRLLEGEERVFASPLPATVIRFGGIYGPGRHRLIDRVTNGSPCTAAPPLYTNRIHRDDCAGVLQHLLAQRRRDPIYIAVDNEPAEECAVMEWMAKRLGCSPPARVGAGDSVGTRANKRCSNARLRASGYDLLYPTFREGYGAVLDTLAE